MVDGPPPLPRRTTAAQDEWAEHLHDLRTPLTVVVGRVQLLRRRLRRGEAPANLDAELSTIEVALARLTTAIGRLDGQRDAE